MGFSQFFVEIGVDVKQTIFRGSNSRSGNPAVGVASVCLADENPPH